MIGPDDRVTGTRDELTHEKCDYTAGAAAERFSTLRRAPLPPPRRPR